MFSAGQRRRSTFSAEDKAKPTKEEEIVRVAQTLAARRDSVTPPAPGVDSAAHPAAAGATAAAAEVGCDSVAPLLTSWTL